MSINAPACVIRSVIVRIGCALICFTGLTAWVPGNGIVNLSVASYAEYFCGSPIRPAREPVTFAAGRRYDGKYSRFHFHPFEPGSSGGRYGYLDQ